jgi:uncharacterized membrane protein YedE/YeeE
MSDDLNKISQEYTAEKEHAHFGIRKYMNPYLAGLGLGLVLLASFVIMGRGLGASGAMSTAVSVGVETVAEDHARSSDFYSRYLGSEDRSPWKDFLVFEVLGVLAGGFLSGVMAGRFKKEVIKGPRFGSGSRLILAFAGGTLMGIGAKFARGCTSGQALTGGALLNVGSWAFMLSIFAGAYLFAYFLRRQWL